MGFREDWGVEQFGRTIAYLNVGNMLSPNAILHWESVNDSSFTLDENTLQPMEGPVDANPYEISDLKNYSLAVSGDVFRWIVDFAPLEVLHRVSIVFNSYYHINGDF